MINLTTQGTSLKRLIIILFIFASSISQVLSQTINFRTYKVTDGLANSNVYYSLQDSRGFLWVATSSGVNRFDGKKFELFTTDNGLADNEVLMIYEDSKGRIWFLNFNGRLGYYFDGKFYNPDNNKILKNAITKGSFISCFEDSNNRLWFATNQQQIIEINHDKVIVHEKPNNHPDTDISNTFIFEDERKRIIAVNSKGFYYIRKETLENAPSQYLPISFKSFHYDNRTKKLLFISKSGLIELSKGQFKVRRRIPEEIANQEMASFLISKNKLWISSVNNGIYIVEPDGKTISHHLAKKVISQIMEDRDGNIWVTTLGSGLIILPANTENVLQYTTGAGLFENTVYSVVKDGSGQLWLGMKSGNINLIDRNRISKFNPLTTNTAYNPIKKLEYDKERKSIWFASNNTLGEISLDKPRKTRYLQEKNNLTFGVKSFSLSRKGKFAFSLASGVYILENKDKPLIFQTQKNLPDQHFFPDRSFKVFYDSHERLWFSNVNGLFRYENNKVDTLSKKSDLFSKRVTDIIELPDGNMVIGTYGYGLLITDGKDRITRMGVKEGLSSNICRRLGFDGKNIWLTTFSGVDKFEYKAARRKITTYKIKNGLTSDEVLDIFIDDKKIYLGTLDGLTLLPRNEPPPKTSSPLFYITNFTVNGKQYKVREIPEFQFNQNTVSVQYTAINFSQAKELYQYRLKEDWPWIETPNNTIEFGSLEPGQYELAIRAKVLDSQWSTPATVPFIIRPAFWQRWWFLASMYFLVSILVIGLIFQYFKKQRKKEHDELSMQSKIILLEQRALQAMMNPHFVFNIMNSIQYFINTQDSQAANQVLTGFARLIRKNLEICTKSYITLDEEMVYLKLYLSLEKLRFGEKMTYEITIDEDLDTEETMIPSMLLQPFVENAIWHGIMPQEEGGNIHINVTQHKNEIVVNIIDNGTGIENSMKNKISSHVSRGMQITQERVSLLNKNKKGTISIHSRQTGESGTKVTVKIPV
ncbi:hypothetical protein GZH53_14225 [Flavihumibacter sp. R14]|nr:hypothetical protein [Flavihumibacter soli]